MANIKKELRPVYTRDIDELATFGALQELKDILRNDYDGLLEGSAAWHVIQYIDRHHPEPIIVETKTTTFELHLTITSAVGEQPTFTVNHEQTQRA